MILCHDSNSYIKRIMNVSVSLQLSLFVFVNYIRNFVINKYILLEIDLQYNNKASYNSQKGPMLKRKQLTSARTLLLEIPDNSQSVDLKGNFHS